MEKPSKLFAIAWMQAIIKELVFGGGRKSKVFNIKDRLSARLLINLFFLLK